MPFTGRTYDAVGQPRRVIAADLDGDGDVDVVDVVTNKIEVRWNQGGGAFAVPINYTITDAEDVVAVDWDGDGDLDLFVTSFSGGSVSALRKGAGTSYAAAGTFPAGQSPSAIAAGDLNGDGLLDLTVTNYQVNAVSVLLGTSATTFAAPVAYAIGGAGEALHLADLDGDGKLDAVVAKLSGPMVSVLRGLGDGTFAPNVPYGGGVHAFDVEPIDLDRDGDLDLAVASTQPGVTGELLYVLWNQAGAFSTNSWVEAGSNLSGLSSADFDGDQQPDLAVSDYGSGTVAIVEWHNASLSVTAHELVAPGPQDAVAADVTGDGWPDLIVVSSEAIGVGIHEGRGDGTFGSWRPIAGGVGPRGVLPGDFTGDGVLDLVIYNFGQVQLIQGLGGGSYAAPVVLPTPPYPLNAVTAGDVDGDGDIDIVVARQQPYSYAVLSNNGTGGFTLGPSAAGNSNSYVGAALADLDGDQDLDLVLQAYTKFEIYLNAGNGVFGSASTYPTPIATQSLVVANLDGDQDLDLAAGGANGSVCVLLNAGNGSFGAGTVYSAYEGDTITALDFDGDGRLDLATAGHSLYRVALLRGNGSGAFSQTAYLQDTQMPLRMISGDVDGDGRPDLITGNDEGTVAVRLNLGGTFAAPARLAAQASVPDVALVDVDQDLDPDLVVVGNSNVFPGAALTLYLNRRTEAPHTYCAAKTSSLGCVPSLAYTGAPSASSAAPFTVSASNLINQKAGLLFYGHSAKAAAFQGGTLCVSPPTRRTPAQNSGGSALPASDCSGAFALDFNAWIQSGVDATLVVGVDVYAQHWSRDPASASTTGLTNALHFVVRP